MSANAECVHRSMLPTRLRRRYMLITHASEAQLGVEDAPPPSRTPSEFNPLHSAENLFSSSFALKAELKV